MAESDDMTDREILIEVWEIACGLESRVTELQGEVGELRSKVAELESEFGPVARRYRKLIPARANGRPHHGSD